MSAKSIAVVAMITILTYAVIRRTTLRATVFDPAAAV
jgi:hypothetical protein